MGDWTDTIVSDRMTVDQEFDTRVQSSDFSNQEWGLIMTATEFEIEHADDPERARIVADTENLSHIMPELDKVRSQMSGMGAGEGDSGGRGIVDTVRDALGFGNGSGTDDEQRVAEAESLTQEYADALQDHLESKGKWDQVRRAYDD
ncbi:DUF5799 family protein [Salinirarus marinus]|uniref:DUF5799 family protein n=1 Tax=Salinirarus marinus TaxID=3068310 RepID=UPI003C6C30A5